MLIKYVKWKFRMLGKLDSYKCQGLWRWIYSLLEYLLDSHALRKQMDNDRSTTSIMDERMLQKKLIVNIAMGKDEPTLSKSLELGRDEGGSEHFRKKSWKAGEYNSGWRSGGQRSANCWVSEKGGSVWAVSHTVAPSDQTSTLRTLYGDLRGKKVFLFKPLFGMND